MLGWGSISEWGRRASDVGATPPVSPTRDLLLEAAIAHEQIDLLFQPIIEAGTGALVGAEALARSPIARDAESLFARAGSAALGERLSRLIQRKALRSAAVWEGPLRNLKISINLLPADISRDGYEQWLLEEIEAAAIDPSRVTLEITESVLLADRDSVAARLATLREAGLGIAVDDFGTGYASLAYLTSLPLDMLKIDRGLVADVVGDVRAQIVIKALIGLARELGLTVVVEGVESTGQLEVLCELGCDLYQGFLGSPPLTQDELMRFAS
ncbi:MAG TPA: EAL domain-containing protein [Sphingomicrobium sp.]|jgi:EAL domain-containing protein (putative c-di-GMP-specific phosphodiesterase class I)